VSDTSVVGATRFNANQTDLNRNFPDPSDYHWESRSREPETLAMMDFMQDIRLVLAANFHGGAEVVNYPWDTWARLHADDVWYRKISRIYADTAHANSPMGYMTDLDNGITNGNAWYTVYGGRQDYVNYFLHAREVTIELAADAMPPESNLDDYWNYNRRSMLQYIGQSLTGITGLVTDSVTGQPLAARIRIEKHDMDNSYVFSSLAIGNYYRLIGAGNYMLRISATDYLPKRQLVSVSEGELTQFNVGLAPVTNVLYPNPFSDLLHFYVATPGNDLQLEFFDLAGRKVKHISQPVVFSGIQEISVKGMASGVYTVRIIYGDEAFKQIMVRNGASIHE